MDVDYPDTEKAFYELLGDLATVYLHLVYGFEESLPALHCYQVGGSERSVFRVDRMVVDSFASGRDAAKALSAAAHARLMSGPHDTTHGLLDLVEVEVAPHGVPYASDTVSQVTAVYRVHTRPL